MEGAKYGLTRTSLLVKNLTTTFHSMGSSSSKKEVAMEVVRE